MTAAAVRSILERWPQRDEGEALADAHRGDFEEVVIHEVANETWPPRKRDPEFSFLPEGSEDLVAALKDHPKPFDREATIRDLAGAYGAALHNATSPWKSRVKLDGDMRERYVADYAVLVGFMKDSKVPADPAKLKAVQNPWGKWWAIMVSGEPDLLLEAEYRRRIEVDATLIALRNRLYALEKGRPAPTLATLKVDFRDPFSDRPYRYDPKRNVLWSVGADGKDDGGKEAPGKAGKDRVVGNVARYAAK